MAGHPFRRAPALRNGLVFGHEFFRRLGECPFGSEEAGASLALQGQEPVFCDILGLAQAFALGAQPVPTAADAGLTIPELTVWSFEELDVTAHQLMIFLHRASSLGLGRCSSGSLTGDFARTNDAMLSTRKLVRRYVRFSG